MIEHTGYCQDCHPKQMHLTTKEGVELVNAANIIKLEGSGNYTTIYLFDGSNMLICHNLGYFEKQLPKCFARSNQSYIVNLHFLQRIETSNWLKFINDIAEKIQVKGGYATEFFARLNRWNISQSNDTPETDLQ